MTRDARLVIGAAVPGALLPVAAAAVAGGAAALIGMPTLWVAVASAAPLLGGIVRMIGGAWIAAALLVIGLVAADSSPWSTATVIAAVHLLQVLGSLMLVIPLRSRIAVRALTPTAVRFVLVQLLCQAVGVLASLLPTRSGLPLAAIAGAVSALVFTVLLVRMLRARRGGAFSKPDSARVAGGSSET
ncbi:hypothetical protein QF046_000155 [Microbacterium sp. W4I4]|uniref:hypothetical protein n=1 Tax=Microbacterium sp. W4I4 TaxID=3042295 RepID=UPI0027893D87|nr:hypothetical protein [Microbacterium sp. W4I4]MDQ0612514.1 hypothetical protein [Microbacterium sp. W4I4]